METIYLETKDRLMQWLNTQYDTKFPVTAGAKPVSAKLQFIDLYNGQFELLKVAEGIKVLPFKFPAILFEFLDLQCVPRLGMRGQQVNGVLRLHIGQECYADSFMMGAVPRNSNNQSLALNTLVYLKQIHRVMQNYSSTDMCAGFDRIAIGQDVNHNNIIVHTLDYSFSYLDNSADPLLNWQTIMSQILVKADKTILDF